VRDIDTVVVDSLKALDLERPIREADIDLVGEGPIISESHRILTSSEFGRIRE